MTKSNNVEIIRVLFKFVPMTKSTDELKGVLLGLCNPLLDICAEVDQRFLDKYALKANDAILATDKHIPLYFELIKDYKVQYIAGGAGQNTMRASQWMLPKDSTVYFGSTGKDEFAQTLREFALKDGLKVVYSEDETAQTGTCAVLITGNHRSLVANLAAANNYKLSHLLKPENLKIVEAAKVYYITGFFLTVSPDSIQYVAKHAASKNKIFTMNLSAPFLCKFFKKQMLAAIPYVDILFGNESEALAFAENNELHTTDIKEIALALSKWTKINPERTRLVIITQGHLPTITAQDGEIRVFEVPLVPKEEIVDTNGAGDAFVGGFLSQLVLDHPIQKCVDAGHYVAGEVIRRSGCTFPEKPKWQ